MTNVPQKLMHARTAAADRQELELDELRESCESCEAALAARDAALDIARKAVRESQGLCARLMASIVRGEFIRHTEAEAEAILNNRRRMMAACERDMDHARDVVYRANREATRISGEARG